MVWYLFVTLFVLFDDISIENKHENEIRERLKNDEKINRKK